MQNLSPLVCKVYFMDGKTKAVSVMPCDTTTEVLENVARRIGLKSVEGWALYEVSVCMSVDLFVCPSNVSVMPCDTTTELLENVARRIWLKSVEGWALYEVSECLSVYPSDVNVMPCDITSAGECGAEDRTQICGRMYTVWGECPSCLYICLSVSVHPEVLENVARRIGLKSVEGWAMYEMSFMGTIVKGHPMSRNEWPRNM